MRFYDALFSAVFNILSIYINVRILKLFLPVKITKAYVTMPIYIGIWLINWVVYYFFNIPDLTTLSLLIGLMTAAIIIFEGSLWKKVLAVIVSNVSGIIAEDIVWELSNRLPLPIESAAVGGLCAVILNFLIILVIERCIALKRYDKLPIGAYMNIIMLSVGSVVLSENIVLHNHSDDSALICLSIICMLNVSTYYIYEKISESWKDKLKNAEMEQQIRMYANQFDIITESQQNMRSIRHDLKNHISLIGIYLQNMEYRKASEYVNNLGEELKNDREYVKTGNFEIDSILNYKLEYVEKKLGFKPDVLIDVPDHSFMSGFDLNILLGNLLDNAMEAISKAEEKLLDIRIMFSKGILYISIYNTYGGELCSREGRLLSTKTRAEYHGVGLENVQKIVKKFNGTMKIGHDGKLFKMDIILFLETEKI